MSTAKNQALLLRANKEAQVAALNELGFTEVTYDTPLSEIAGYIRWCCGLWDIRLACVKTGDSPTIHYFTDEEWEAMSVHARAQYEPIGACIRAHKHQFIVAAKGCNNNGTLAWGLDKVDVGGAKNYWSGSTGLYDIPDSEGETSTKAIVEQAVASSTTAPAAQACWAYKGSENDPCQWYLPTIIQLRIICAYRTQINTFLSKRFAGNYHSIGANCHWASTEINASQAWNVEFSTGALIPANSYKSISFSVRAVSSANFSL